jgi:hypothetical protein
MGKPMQFAMRTRLLAVRVAQAIGLSDTDLHTTYYTALLRSAGCTAGNHVQHIYHKLGMSTRAAVTLFAIQHDRLGEVVKRFVSGKALRLPRPELHGRRRCGRG